VCVCRPGHTSSTAGNMLTPRYKQRYEQARIYASERQGISLLSIELSVELLDAQYRSVFSIRSKFIVINIFWPDL
jgi:hypothetical protein